MDQEYVLYRPAKAFPAGFTLKETLDAIGMTQKDLSDRTGLTPKTINEIINGKGPITPETAIKLERVLNISAIFWNNLETFYQQYLANLDAEKKLEPEMKIASTFTCYLEMVKNAWIEKTNDLRERTKNLLKFFGVDSLAYVENTLKIPSLCFRIASGKNVSKTALTAWLRQGEIESERVKTEPYNKDLLKKILPELRELSLLNPNIYGKKIIELCASAGVAVVFVESLKNTYVNGATKWLSSDKALVQLSVRNRFADIFWFSFFHELGHILLHGKTQQFLEFENKDDQKEREADNFATDNLIPKDLYNNLCQKSNLSTNDILSFAKELKISPGIVAGRLAHDEKIDWKTAIRFRQKLIITNTDNS